MLRAFSVDDSGRRCGAATRYRSLERNAQDVTRVRGRTRLKACTTCKIVYDSDNMAAQSLQQALRQICQTGQRPNYLYRSATSAVEKAKTARTVYGLEPRPQRTVKVDTRTRFLPRGTSSFYKTLKHGGDIRL